MTTALARTILFWSMMLEIIAFILALCCLSYSYIKGRRPPGHLVSKAPAVLVSMGILALVAALALEIRRESLAVTVVMVCLAFGVLLFLGYM